MLDGAAKISELVEEVARQEMPAVAMTVGLNTQWAYFYGGTSLLITVGVILDTLQQIESYLLNRHYDGLMKTGKLRCRNTQSTFS